MEISDSIALSHRQYRPAVQWQECFPGHSAEALWTPEAALKCITRLASVILVSWIAC